MQIFVRGRRFLSPKSFSHLRDGHCAKLINFMQNQQLLHFRMFQQPREKTNKTGEKAFQTGHSKLLKEIARQWLIESHKCYKFCRCFEVTPELQRDGVGVAQGQPPESQPGPGTPGRDNHSSQDSHIPPGQPQPPSTAVQGQPLAGMLSVPVPSCMEQFPKGLGRARPCS